MDERQLWEEYARVYDRVYQEIGANRELLAQMVSTAGITSCMSVLDLCGGTGNLLLALAEKDLRPHVSILDRSLDMLAQAEPKARRYGGLVAIRQADLDQPAETWGVDPHRQFDCIIDCNGSYTLNDPAATLRELAKLAKPGAVLVQTVPKPGANVKAIFDSEIERRAALGKDPDAERGPLMEQLLPVIKCNEALLRLYGPRFFTPEQVESALRTSGWDPIMITEAYCGTNSLAHAVLAA